MLLKLLVREWHLVDCIWQGLWLKQVM
uniref:Protein trpH n=1 Tax=Arundo donax TaxID=35708 RepID=A0A0A9EFJ9_ARUDO